MIPDNFYVTGPPTSSSPPSSQSHHQEPHLLSSSSSPPSYSYSSSWSRVQDKQFESALVTFPEETPNRWEKIASCVPGKTPLEIERHYQILLDDINAIEAGLVELPCYTDDLIDSNKSKASETERRKGTPWSEEEHKLFLIGLQRYGKGDWRSISRNAVVSRTPTQVASHAQKYFNRINSDKKEKKRSSIHDITVDEATIRQASSQNSNMPGSDLSQQTVDTLSSQSQVSFSNQGSTSAYQSYGYPM